MNNNFDNDRSSGQDPFGGHQVYSKQYTPKEDGYSEEKSCKRSPFSPKRGGKTLAIIGITLAVLLVFSGSTIFIAQVAFSQYDRLYEEYEEYRQQVEGQTRPDTDETDGAEITEAPEESEAQTEQLVFSSEGDMDIGLSDTKPAVVGGAIGDPNLTMADVVALVADSVVEITTSETYRNGLVYQSGAGSGVIVNQSGIIITNNHVIEDASNIAVRLTNGSIYEATLVATDPETDIAVIKIEPKETLTVAVRGNSDNLVVGEEVLAIGNPLGLLGGTVTNGIISALEREMSVGGETMTLLQHNAAISPGNSGGALFNMRGELIGIVNAKYSSSDAEGLGFAIPMNAVMPIYEDLCNYGYVKGRADHGLTIVSESYYFFQGYLYIYDSRYSDELVKGDRLISIDGKTPSTTDDAYAILEQFEIGDQVVIVVLRNNKQISVTLEIHEYTPLF